MNDDNSSGTPCRRSWLLAGALLLALAVVLAVAVLPGQEDPDGAEQAPPAAATSTLPPYPPAPYSRVDDVTLTVPEEGRFAQGTFWAEAGTDYVVTMDLESTKPEGSGGRSMYLGVTLSCSPQAGGPGISVGGTQNMLTGEVTTYSNQGIVSVPEDGGIDCSIKVSAPYDDVASNGTTFEIDGTWRADPVDGEAIAASEDGLPRTVEVGTEEVVMTADLPLDTAAEDQLRALTTLHLTACTIVNGSREDGRAWCSEGSLDEDGSVVTVDLQAQLVDEKGEVCDVLGGATTDPDHIDLYRHHRVLSLELVEELPEAPCGQTVRLSASVHNEGPAPVVVHRSNSSLVGVGG